MKKKIVALFVCVAMLALIVIGGTMAYFTDSEARTNVFTVGEIKIDLIEDFDDTADMLPDKAIKKVVSIKNVGKNDAYVRVHIAVPAFAAADGTVIDVISLTNTNADWTFAGTTYSTEIGGIPYKVYVATYPARLVPTQTALNAIDAVTLNAKVNQDDITLWNKTYGEGEWAKVYVYGEGVQADSFADAEEAMAKAFGTPGTDYVPVFTAFANAADEARLIQALGLDAAGNVNLTKDIKTTANVALNGGIIDGNGKSLTKVNHAAADGTVNAGIIPTGGTIKNITISGESVEVGGTTYGFRAIYVTKGLSSNLYVEGATLEGTYAINIQDWEVPPASTGALIVKNSVINGWTSYDGGITGARFTDTEFVTTGSLACFKPYVDTVLTGCDFAAGYTFSTGSADALIIELNDCTVAGTALTADNFTSLITVDAADALRSCSVIVDGVNVVF